MRKLEPASCALVFDMGGVVIDWDPRYLFQNFFPGDAEGLERFLVEIDFWNWNAQMDRGRTFAEGVVDWSKKFPRYASMIQAFDIRWEETASGPIRGMPDLLRRLRGAGHSLYGLSNSSAEKFPLLKKKYTFLGDFSKIVLSGDLGVNKPDPRIYEGFLEQTGRKPEDLLLIDDTEVNLSAARGLGWKAIFFSSAEQLELELAERGLL
jgi:2-haloacid dehalogenase